jgi:hypothetical protein
MDDFLYDDSDLNTIPTMFISAMKIKISTYFGLGMISLTLAAFLIGCQDSQPKLTNSSPTPTVAAPSSTQEAPATISQIYKKPVWLKRLNTTTEIFANEGMGVFVGEQIRTVGEALAEIKLKNGLAFRIGGNSVLTMQPDNSLNLNKGEMITWVQPGKQVPAKVVTPGAIAGIRGTTIYINIPEAPNSPIEYFTWEGTMSLALPNQSEEILLKAGEIVKIQPGETDINQMRKRVRKLTDKEWETRRHKSRLINNFSQPLPTLDKIDKVTPKEAKKSTLSPQLIQPSAPTKVNNNSETPTLKFSQPATPTKVNNNSETPTLKFSQPSTPKKVKNNPTPTLKISQPVAPTKVNNNSATPSPSSPDNSKLGIEKTPKLETKQSPTPNNILWTPLPKTESINPPLKPTPVPNPKATANSPTPRQVENNEYNKDSE